MEHQRDIKRVVVFGAAGAIVVAIFGLLGYVPGLGLLGSVREDYIPMAPSTAVSFIVLGGILLAMTLRSLSGASLVLFGVLVAMVSLFGALEVAGHFTERDLNFEDALVPAAGYLREIPIARMSPSTGALFLFAGLAAFVLLLRVRAHGRETRLGHWGGGLGSLVLGVGLLFCLAYLYGSPLLYGQGATVPMALTTALAFLMLGAAAVGAAGKNAIPVRLLAGANRAAERMSARQTFLFLTLIMVGACATVMAIMTAMLYRQNVQEHRSMLQVTAQSQARLIESVARYGANLAGALLDADPSRDAYAATLSQIIDAHEHYEGFGKTGEFTLARREGDSIVFLLRHRHGGVERPEPAAFDSDLAAPMRRAIEGLSGTVIGLDYRGETVLAAHEPVGELNLGIVAKIDLAEIRAPFIKSSLTGAAIALFAVLAGTALFFRTATPIIARLEAYSRDLEKEVDERKEAEEELQKHRNHLEDLVRERTTQLDARVAEAEELNSAMVNVMEDLRASNVKLEATGRELTASNEELDAFSYSVSHDLRAPLRHVDGFVKLLLKREKGRLDPTSSHYLETITESSNRMGRLIDDLLAFSRTGRTESYLQRVDSNEVVREARKELSFRTEGRRITWEVADLPAVEADRGLLRLVWENLIDNAIKYTGPREEARIEIGATREGDGEGSSEVAFFVRDNGVGFDPQYTHKLFGVFQRLHGDDEFQGTGIGLATVRRIVHRHGGRVWAEGEVDHGATFYFTLKAARGEE